MQPISFSECNNYVLDPFWQELILECSTMHFPKGIIYNSQRGTLKTHQGTFEIPIHPIDCANLLLKLFRSIGLKSPQDLNLERENFDKENISRGVVVVNEGWKKIKPRSMRETFILNYVCELGELLRLTSRERDKLYKTICIGMFTKVIDNDDIEYSNESEKITFIRKINFNSTTRAFSFTETKIQHQKSYRQIRKTIFCQKLNRYIKGVRDSRLPKIKEDKKV